jgi:SpoVK/Ycf46/Vps4 family AAA+-type ATPase
MSRSKDLLKNMNENLTQFTQSGSNVFRCSGATKLTLEPGVYEVGMDMRGPYFEKANIQTDELIRINTSKYNYLSEEIDKFYDSKDKYTKLGFVDKRAAILHSIPGVGKSCLLKQVMEGHTKKGHITFLPKSLSALGEALREFREVEKDRKILVILEELDEMLYDHHVLSNLMDGPTSVGGIFYLATTNYIDRIPERMKRPSRFDRIIEMGPPSEQDRLEYFKAKLGMNEDEDTIKKYVKATDGFTFAGMKEFLVSVCCLGNSVEDTIMRLKGIDPGAQNYGRMKQKQFVETFTEMYKAAKKKKTTEQPIVESAAKRLMKGF